MEDDLTDEQRALIPEYYDKWMGIALSTEPGNHERAEELFTSLYKENGHKKPKMVFWADSPVAGARLAALLARPENAVVNPTKKKLQQMVAVTKDYPEPTKEEIRAQLSWSKIGFGQHDAHWLGYYDFYINVLQADNLEGARWLIELAKEVSWYWTFEYAVVAVEKQVQISIDEQGRLNSTARKAIEFGDGFGLYQYHGISLPAQVIEAPETLTAEQILTEPNAEIRRAMIEILGLDHFFAKVDHKVLDEDVDELGLGRRLLEIELENDENIVVVEVTNSTPEPTGEFKKYWIRVHPEIRPMNDDGTYGDPQPKTAAAAIATTFGMTAKDYKLVDQS